MGASVRTIKANVLFFIQTKASQPTFVFDESNMDSNNKTVNEMNKETNNNTDDNNKDNVTDQDVFYGIAILKNPKNIETVPLYSECYC